MSKIATVRVFWNRSVSPDIVKLEVEVNNGGVVTTTTTGPETEELIVKVRAQTTCTVVVKATDLDGKVAVSEVYARTLGDLVDPQPVTGLGSEIISIEDEPEPEPAPTPEPTA